MPVPTIPETVRHLAYELGVVMFTFAALLAIGRTLKRRFDVRLGVTYKLFAGVISLYLPFAVSGDAFPGWPGMTRHLGAASLLLGIGVFIALMRRFFWEGWFERTQKTRAPKFLSQLIGLVLFVAGVLFIVGGIYGQSIEGAVFGSTVVLGIVGFAMQDLLGNIIAGIALELGKPFRVGDWLVVDSKHAEVMEVNWRSTRLRTNDDVYLDIPNKMIVGSTITNLTYPNRQHALRLVVGFDYSVRPNFIKDVMSRATAEVPGVLARPAPRVFLRDFGESAILYEIKFWIEDETSYNQIVDGIRTNVWYAAQRANIRIPFPILTLQIERGVGKASGGLNARLQTVRKHPFFQLLDDEQLETLVTQARVQRFGRGEKVIEQGADGQSMFVLLSGEADVLVGAHGERTHVATLRAGDYCGEMSLLTGEPRSATVVARSDCEMWEIDKLTMGEVLQKNESLVHQLGEILAERKLATDGILASSGSRHEVMEKQQEYTRGFLRKLSAFFDL